MPRRTPKQRQHRRYDPLVVLCYIASYRRQHAPHSPSQRRIQLDLGISAPSVVHNVVHRLQRAKLLSITTYGRGRSGDLTLTEAGLAAVQAWQQDRATAE